MSYDLLLISKMEGKNRLAIIKHFNCLLLSMHVTLNRGYSGTINHTL